mgnify:CR=1 FL=1
MKKLVVVFVLIFVLCLSVIGAASADNFKNWSAAYTYEVPPGTFLPGLRFYQYKFDWTYPAPESNTSAEATFFVDENAPLYPGYVVLRGEFGAFAKPLGEHGRNCIEIDPVIHPDQPVRFHIGWGTDYPMSPKDAKLHFESMVTTVLIDGVTHEMTGQEVAPSGMGNRWPNNICSYTVRN